MRGGGLDGYFGEHGLPVGIHEYCYSNSIRVGYDRVEQIREGVLWNGLEGNLWEEGLPPCIQSQLECLHG